MTTVQRTEFTDQWRGFTGQGWRDRVDVAEFIRDNHLPYERIMSLEEEINAHTQAVEVGRPIRYGSACPGWRRRALLPGPRLSSSDVSRNRQRARQSVSFRPLAMELHSLRKAVHGVPSFALPHKRFVSQDLLDRARDYLGSQDCGTAAVPSAGEGR